MSVQEHEDQARRSRENAPIGTAILTISDTRSAANDASGNAIARHLQEEAHQIRFRALVPDDGADIRQAILAAAATEGVEALLMTGGTGISKRDGTTEQLQALPGIDIDGFGELFRSISYQAIGPAALLSRATARVLEFEDGRRLPVFAMPGSEHAVDTAMEHVIIPVLRHVVWETVR